MAAWHEPVKRREMGLGLWSGWVFLTAYCCAFAVLAALALWKVAHQLPHLLP